jgi:large subunit ribosomal protein L28
VQNHTIYVPELGRSIRLKISARALRTLNKKGLQPLLQREGLTLKNVM